MITDIPTPEEFRSAAINQLYLAWQIAMQAMHQYEELTDYSAVDGEEADKAAVDYWRKSQPALANAFGLIQQSMEMALKGRIAEVSPYLLISRDPKDWPKGVDKQPVPFSDFRTLDASDLIKVHNSFIDPPLDQAFRDFWDETRRDRNKVMHSVSSKSFDPATLVRAILTAAEYLFNDIRWPQRLLAMEADGAIAAYGLDDSIQNAVMRQIDTAIRNLNPAENKRFFGFHDKRRAYVCPHCWYHANRDWQDDWPALAQFPERKPGSVHLYCTLCDKTTEVERVKCTNGGCLADAIYEDMCLTCMATQDDPRLLATEPLADDFETAHYCFEFACGRHRHGGTVSADERQFVNDDAAREHGRRALNSVHLQNWETVTIKEKIPFAAFLRLRGNSDRLLGTWERVDGEIVWKSNYAPEFDGLLNCIDNANL